ncbi:hypothetical protein [Streptomyces sp. 5-10]|nr:hypothetical protein [Streptomyces sp. 5-10]
MTPHIECSHATWRSTTAVFIGSAIVGGLSGWAGVMGLLIYFTS